MRCCASGSVKRCAGWWRWALLCFAWLCLPVWGLAQTPSTAVQVWPDGSDLYLSARLSPSASAGFEPILLRGVPMHFVWQAQTRRSRWYWSDEKIAIAYRNVRVAYQPLTQRWRVSVGLGASSESDMAGAWHQNLDTFAQAMAAVFSISRWRLAQIPEGYSLADFKVDVELRSIHLGQGSELYRATLEPQALPPTLPDTTTSKDPA